MLALPRRLAATAVALLRPLAVLVIAALFALAPAAAPAQAVGGGVVYNQSGKWIAFQNQYDWRWYNLGPGDSSGWYTSDAYAFRVPRYSCLRFDYNFSGRWTTVYTSGTAKSFYLTRNEAARVRNC